MKKQKFVAVILMVFMLLCTNQSIFANKIPKTAAFTPMGSNISDYRLDKDYYSTVDKDMNISYTVNDISLFPEEDFTVSVEIKNSDGTSLSKSEDVVPGYIGFNYDYNSGWFYIDIPMPSVTKNGEYDLYTSLKFSDGSVVTLDGKKIHIGYYEIVNSIYTDGALTPSTKEVAVTVDFGTYVKNPGQFSVSLTDGKGSVLGTSSMWYYYPNSVAFNSDRTYVMYIVTVSAALARNEYYNLNLAYTGDKELVGIKSNDVYCYEHIEIISSVNMGNNMYSLYLDGVPEGTYVTYSSKYIGVINGMLSVGADGKAVLTLTEEYDEDEGIDVYIHIGEDEYNLWFYPYDSVPEKPSLSYTLPNFLKPGSTSLDNLCFSVLNRYIMNIDDIKNVQLVSGDNVVAEGENITYDGWDSQYYYTKTDVECYRTSYCADFPIIDNAKIQNKKLTLKVTFTDGSAECEIPVLGDDEGEVYGEISLKNAANADGGEIEVGYRYYYADYIASLGNIEFEVAFTNKTEGMVILQKIDEDDGWADVAELSLSDLTRSSENGYTYTGSFNDKTKVGGFYRIKFGNSYSDIFTVKSSGSQLNCYSKRTNIIKDSTYVWMYGLNVDFKNGNFSAFYNNASGKKVDVPMTVENSYGTSASVVFDFSDVAAFTSLDLHLCYNGTEVDTMKVTDDRNKVTIESYISENNGVYSICMYGNKMDEIENLKLKFWKLEEYKGIDVFSKTPVKEVDLTIPKSGSTQYYFDLTSLDIDEGEYVYGIFEGDVPTDYSMCVYIPSARNADVSAELTKKSVSGSKITVNVKNTSENNIKNAELIVCAYDSNGVLTKMTTKTVSVNANSSSDIILDTVSGAAEYKVFLWKSLNKMKPIAANL